MSKKYVSVDISKINRGIDEMEQQSLMYKPSIPSSRYSYQEFHSI